MGWKFIDILLNNDRIFEYVKILWKENLLFFKFLDFFI